MKNLTQTLIVFIVGLLGGLVGTLLFSPSANTGDSASQEQADGGAVMAKQLEAMQEQLDGLARSVDFQGSALSRLEDRQSGMAQQIAESLAKGVLPDGSPIAAPLDLGELPAGPGFDNMVAAVIEKRDQEQAAEREARRQERQKEMIDQRAKTLAEELGLDSQQTEQLASALLESSEARNKMFQEMRETGTFDREAIRNGMEEIRTKELSQLQSFLTPTQIDQYQQQANEAFGGRFGGRPRNDSGGSTGGGFGGGGGGGGGRGGF